MKGLIAAASALLATTALADPTTAPAPTPSAELHGRIVAIADGDTLTLLVDRTQVRIRLAQIDAPESGQPYGRASKKALSALAFGKPARVVVVDTDRYGRTVGEVFVGEGAGVHVNQEMVRQGHAWAYTRYARTPDIIALEDEARAASRGLWTLPLEQRDAPWVWRHRGRSKRKAKVPSHPPASMPLACGNRDRCREMASCEEARFYLERCGVGTLDGDGDGIPCEKLCGGGGRDARAR